MRSRKIRRLAALVLAMQAVVTTSAVPAFADGHQGTVTATVTVAEAPEACILLGVESIDFGVVGFGETQPMQSNTYSISSCTDGSQDLLVRGTEATLSSDANTFWQLGETSGINTFALSAVVSDGDPNGQLNGPVSVLADVNTLVVSGLSGQDVQADHTLTMPDVNSSAGTAGDQFSFQIIWTATLSD